MLNTKDVQQDPHCSHSEQKGEQCEDHLTKSKTQINVTRVTLSPKECEGK